MSYLNSAPPWDTAYSPVRKCKFPDDPAVSTFANAHGPGVATAQVLLSCGDQQGTAVLSKASHSEHLRGNVEVSQDTYTGPMKSSALT